MTKMLFVGGIAAGRVIDVDDSVPVIELPHPNYLDNPAVFKISQYHRTFIFDGEKMHFVFAEINSNPIRELLDFYRSAKR